MTQVASRGCGMLEARAGIEPAIELLQSPALPLGYLAETPPEMGRAVVKAQSALLSTGYP